MLAGRRGPHARQHHDTCRPNARHSGICDILEFHFIYSLFCFFINPNEPHREKTGFLPRRKQRRRSASR